MILKRAALTLMTLSLFSSIHALDLQKGLALPPLLPQFPPLDGPALNPLPEKDEAEPRVHCSKLAAKEGEELSVARFGPFEIAAPRDAIGNPVPLRASDCDGDGQADLQIAWSEGSDPVRFDFRDLCKDGIPTEIRVLILTDNAVLKGYRDGRPVATATAERRYEIQELKLRDEGGFHTVEIVGNQMCLLDVCWECSPIEPQSNDCFALPLKEERLGATERHGISLTAARDHSGRTVPLSLEDCDGDGDSDIFVPWSESATAHELAAIRFKAPCETGAVTRVTLEIGAFAHAVTLTAFDRDGLFADSVTLPPSGAMQTITFDVAAGVGHIELDGAEICIGDLCWECGEPEAPPIEPGCVTVRAAPGERRASFELGNALLTAATHPDFSPRLQADDCNGDGRTDVFIPWSEASATTPAALHLGNACPGSRSVLKIELVLELFAGTTVLRAYDSAGNLVHTATAPGAPRLQRILLESAAGIARVEFEGAEICVREVCWDCGEPEPTVDAKSQKDPQEDPEQHTEKRPRFLRGDTTSDGAIDISDALGGLRHLFLGGRLECHRAADVDDSGAVEMADSLFLLQHLFRGGDAPPAPFGACGVDPTPDLLGCESPPTCR